MAKRTRVTISIDADILDWASERATKLKSSVAEQLRWTLREGMWHLMDQEAQHYRIGQEESAYAR